MGEVIHIGYHRTGSTFLQELVFPALPVNQAIKPDLYHLFDDDFDPAVLADRIAKSTTIDPARPTLISHEMLSGSPEGGSIERRHRTARRLHATYPRARILAVVRNQIDYVLSIYAYRVLIRGLESRTLSDYLAAHHDALVESLQYDKLIADYIGLFGEDAVMVAPFEQLGEDARRFVDDIVGFIGVEPPAELPSRRINESTRSDLIVGINRALNLPLDRTVGALARDKRISHDSYLRMVRPYFVVKERALNPALRRIVGKKGARLAAPRDWVDAITPVLRESNRRLAALADVDLAHYGYVI